MNDELIKKLQALREDYERVMGTPFKHFFCPVLHRDDPVPLCLAHIVPAGFRDSARRCTVQRADVDTFYGSVFESDFLAVQERGKRHPIEVLSDRKLSRQLQPKIVRDGKEVEHFVSDEPPPAGFTSVTVDLGDIPPLRLVLKLEPSDVLASLQNSWEVTIAVDVRVQGLGALIKSAYLTVFDMLGYQYALSGPGSIVGQDILGKFFIAHSKQRKRSALAKARDYFAPYVNLVRPVVSETPWLKGTVTDRLLYVCTSGVGHWGLVVFVRTADLMHAVVLPAFENVEAGVRFYNFLKEPPPRLEVKLTRFLGDRWEVSTQATTFQWSSATLT